jgi:hypothetical protein
MDSETTVTSGSLTPSKSIHSVESAETTRSLLEKNQKALLEINSSPSNDFLSFDGAYGGGECMSESMLESSDESFKTIEHYFEGLITSIKSYSDGFSHNIIVASALSPTYVYTYELNKGIQIRI